MTDPAFERVVVLLGASVALNLVLATALAFMVAR